MKPSTTASVDAAADPGSGCGATLSSSDEFEVYPSLEYTASLD